MYIYEVKSRFLCGPLKRYLPVGARIARYENAVKLVIDEAPQSDQDIFNILVDGITYTDPNQVTWMYSLEPPPLGTSDRGVFSVIGQKNEDAYGNVSAGGSIPTNSILKIDETTGEVYFKSITNGLYYQLRVTGTDGSVALQVGQTGISL